MSDEKSGVEAPDFLEDLKNDENSKFFKLSYSTIIGWIAAVLLIGGLLVALVAVSDKVNCPNGTCISEQTK